MVGRGKAMAPELALPERLDRDDLPETRAGASSDGRGAAGHRFKVRCKGSRPRYESTASEAGCLPIVHTDRSRAVSRAWAAGQSVVELALLLPLLLFMFLAVIDFARVYTALLTIESAAREAADHGTLYPWQWDPAYRSVTEGEMELRACTSARSLPDYVGPDDNCTNPSFSYALLAPPSAPTTDLDTCHLIPRANEPCRVEVTLGLDFHLISPLNIQLFDVTLGLPSQLSFERSSTFAISDFEIDPGGP